MVDAIELRVWTRRALVVGLGLVVMFFQLLPVDALPARLAGPDVMLALLFALAVRRPAYVPFWLVGLLMLLADLVFQRPPGLWAALTVISLESLKTRERRSRETAFAMEWAAVATGLIVMALIYQIALWVLIIPIANAPLLASQTVLTILAYPVAAALVQLLFGRAGRGGGETDRTGYGR
ncbi:rod shape-determining protein MreD [Roseivivax sp. CAU 1761]